MVRIHPDPPTSAPTGAIAQLGERLLCKQEVIGSIPIGSTRREEEKAEGRRGREKGEKAKGEGRTKKSGRARMQQSISRCGVDWCFFWKHRSADL
jgi:hypothetical protein